MNDEIKEILENLKENISIVSIEEEHLLLDYITNLQEEYKYLSQSYYDLHEKYYKLQLRIEKAVEILKDTNVDMPSILLIETIDNGINILNGRSDE